MGQSHSNNKDMSPEEYDQLVMTTGFSSAEIHELQVKFQNDFPKGYIDKKSFRTAYMAMFPQGSGADKFSDHIFRIFDADGNGHISFQELVAALNVNTKGTVEDKLKSAFRLYDADRSGSITQKELTDILIAIYKSRKDPNAKTKAKEDATMIMLKLDTDHNKKLSEAEFIQAAQNCPAVLAILDS